MLVPFLFACDSADDTDDTGDTDDTDVLECTGEVDIETVAPGCRDAGGICVASGGCGGEVLAEHDAECGFDDGPGQCCKPPAASASGSGCADLGGTCAPIAGCNFVNGWFAPGDDCGPAAPIICCVPFDTCEGYGLYTCCQPGMTAFRASCERGEVICEVPETELMCVEDCELP